LGLLSGTAMGSQDKVKRAARPLELRRQAVFGRRAASVPTSGSGTVDRLLVVLAEQLERDASVLEQVRKETK